MCIDGCCDAPAYGPQSIKLVQKPSGPGDLFARNGQLARQPLAVARVGLCVESRLQVEHLVFQLRKDLLHVVGLDLAGPAGRLIAVTVVPILAPMASASALS